MALRPELSGDAPGGLQLDPVALAVIDGEGEEGEARFPGDCGRDQGIQASGKEGDGFWGGGGHGGRG